MAGGPGADSGQPDQAHLCVRSRGPQRAPAPRAVPPGSAPGAAAGPLPDRTLDAIGQQLAVSAEIDETLQSELAATATASAAVPGKLSAASCASVRSARTCTPTAWVTTVP